MKKLQQLPFRVRADRESKVGSRKLRKEKKNLSRSKDSVLRNSVNCNCAGSSVIIWEGYETSDQVHMKGQRSQRAALNASQWGSWQWLCVSHPDCWNQLPAISNQLARCTWSIKLIPMCKYTNKLKAFAAVLCTWMDTHTHTCILTHSCEHTRGNARTSIICMNIIQTLSIRMSNLAEKKTAWHLEPAEINGRRGDFFFFCTCLPFLYWLYQLPGFSLFHAANFT